MRRAVIVLLPVSLVALCPVTACRAQSGRAEIDLSGPTPATSFRGFHEPVDATAPARVPSYALPLDLAQLANPSDLPGRRNDKFTATVAKFGFGITFDNYYEDVVAMYKQLGERDVPVYVTADSLLHLYHVQFAETLRQVEEKQFLPSLRTWVSRMAARSTSLRRSLRQPPLKEAAFRNDVFLAVAGALLAGQERAASSDARVRELADKELGLITAHKGFALSPLFHYREDYSQYVPRGHYMRSPELERYFRGLMWLGRMPMLLKGKERGITDALVDAEEAGVQTSQAALLAATVYGADAQAKRELREPWERIYAVTSFYVGTSDDLTPREYAEEMSRVLGAAFEWSKLADPKTRTALRDALAARRAPRIFGGTGETTVMPPFSPEQLDKVLAATQGMRVMGQRFVPDSYFFQELVFPRAGEAENASQAFTKGNGQRVFPRGLDVFGVLGSERAVAIMDGDGDTAYRGYRPQLDKLRSEVAAFTDADWSRNLYWCWLDALRALVRPAPEGYPTYMRTPAWDARMLQQALASWAELRHDTILYAKQSYTPMVGAAPGPHRQPPPMALGYVEPVPEFYARLLSLTRMTLRGLDAYGLLDDESRTRLGVLGSTLERLLAISKCELTNEWLETEDYAFIKGVGKTLAGATQGVDTKGTSSLLVADVHTDTNSGQCLEEAVGPILTIAVVWQDPDGKLRCATGPVLPYFEFKQPIAKRLTDDGWQELLRSGHPPDPPAWVRQFTVTAE